MKSTFRILFYVKKDKQRADGTFPIMCRITIDGQASRFNTKANVNPNVWNAKTGVAIGKSKEAVEINILLDSIKQVSTTFITTCKPERITLMPNG